MKISALMMEKNEYDLLDPWARFHGSLLGHDNLHIYDNGSDPEMAPHLARVEARGIRIDRSRREPKDFAAKGAIFAKHIRRMDASAPSDFYLPLDCDEFVGVRRDDGSFSFERSDMEQELERHLGSPSVLRIAASYDNHPVDPDLFIPNLARRKCFFAQDACLKLDEGFHDGVSKAGRDTKQTNLVHIHLHFRRFAELQYYSRQKLVGWVENFEPETLKAYKAMKGRSRHVVDWLLLENEEAYLAHLKARYARARYVRIPAFCEKLRQLGIEHPYFGGAALQTA